MDRWRDKLRASVPGWFHSDKDGNASRFLNSLAELFSSLEKNITGSISQLFIDKAEGEFLDQHAKERGLVRFENETDVQLRSRIKNLSANNDCETLRAAAEQLAGEAEIYENNNFGFYVGSFAGDDTVIQDDNVANSFAVVVPDKGATVLGDLIETINARKAFGIGWKLWVRNN